MWVLFLHRCLLADAKAEPLQDWTLDDGVLMVKLDLTHGGAIAYVSKSGSPRNLVNSADEGRYIQQSYYAGQAMNRRAEGQSPAWSPWSWNPIQGGDAHRNRAKVLQFQASRNSFYVKCIPLLWDMNNQPAEAEMEQWTTLTSRQWMCGILWRSALIPTVGCSRVAGSSCRILEEPGPKSFGFLQME